MLEMIHAIVIIGIKCHLLPFNLYKFSIVENSNNKKANFSDNEKQGSKVKRKCYR